MNDFVMSVGPRKWQRIGLIAGGLTGLLLFALLQRTALVGFGMLAGGLAGRAVDARKNGLMSAFFVALTLILLVGGTYIAIQQA